MTSASLLGTTIDAETLASIRVVELAPPPELSAAVERTDHAVAGDPDIVAGVHRPIGATGALPCFYSIRGGARHDVAARVETNSGRYIARVGAQRQRVDE